MEGGLLEEAKKVTKNPDAIIDMYDLTYVWISKKLADINGFPASEMLGKQITDFHEDLTAGTREIIMNLLLT